MNLTKEDWVKLLTPLVLGTAILVPLGQLFIREWYQPYVQYATAGAYIHPKLAVASVGLRNWGRSDAENVTITASFADSLSNFSTDQMATPFDISDGGPGHKYVIGTIKRLAPGETVNIYFTMEPSSPWVDQKPSIRVIKFNNGMGKTGPPVLFFWALPMLLYVVFLGSMIVGLNYWAQRNRQSFNDRLRKAIQLGASARQEGVSTEELNTRVENFRQAIPYYKRPWKDTLIACAQTAFEGAKQTPTQTAGPMS